LLHNSHTVDFLQRVPSCYSNGKAKASKFPSARTAGGTNGSPDDGIRYRYLK
jgi:hypothetical protein